MSILGSRLKALRESRQIPLEAIYERTRIPIDTLKLLESGDFGTFPRVYIQSFIRGYCREIGIRDPALTTIVQFYDRDDVIDSVFRAETEPPVAEPVPHPVERVREPDPDADPDQVARPERGSRMESGRVDRWFHSYKWMAAGGALLLLIGWLVVDIFIGDDLTTDPPVVALDFNQVSQAVATETARSPVVETTGEPGSPEPSPTVSKPDTATTRTVYKPIDRIPSMDSLQSVPVRIESGADSTWLSLVIDGVPSVNYTMPPNRVITRTGRHFSVTIGRVRQVKVSVNQIPVNLPASEGAVFNWVITGPIKQRP